MFNKQRNLNFTKHELHDSFQSLIYKVLSILSSAVQDRRYIPTREILRVIPTENGYSELTDTIDDLTNLVFPAVHSLKEFEQCCKIISENELLRSQSSYCFVILSSFIRDYIEGLNPTITFDQERFDHLFEKYMYSLLALTFESIHICPLIGFESNIDSVILDEGLTIRKLTSDELNEMWNLAPIFDSEKSFKRYLSGTKYLIEHRLILTNDSNWSYSGSNLIQKTIFSLRLYKSGNFWANRQFQKVLFPWMIKSPVIFGNDHSDQFFSDRYNYFFSEDEIFDLKRIYNLVKNFDTVNSNTNYKYVSRAIEWFDKYFNESNIEHQFIFLMILLETLCSDGAEAQYKLSNRISLVIGENDEERISIIKNFKYLYSDRSSIIHGRSLRAEKIHLQEAEDYSRRLLQKFLLFCLKNAHDIL